MNCSSTEELFERFLDGQLAPAERGGMLAHVDGCANCHSVLEELRVVDALLLEPRRIELTPNFTFATMAEARALPPPAVYNAPIRAYVVSYLAAAWMIAGAAVLLAPQMTHAVTATILDVGRSVADAIGGLGTVISRAFGHGGSTMGAILGALLALDAMLVAALGAALKYVRPRLVERLRS